MSSTKKFKYECMALTKLTEELRSIKQLIRFHDSEKKLYSDGLNYDKYEYHKNEAKELGKLKSEVAKIIKSRQIRMF